MDRKAGMVLLALMLSAAGCRCLVATDELGGDPTLALAVTPASIESSGEAAVFLATARFGAEAGIGAVRFVSSAGSLRQGAEATLDDLGEAPISFTCGVDSDPGCVGSVTVTATWSTTRGERSATVVLTLTTATPECLVGRADRLDPWGGPFYFMGAQPLPAGRYRLRNLGGCMKYGQDQHWTVHALANGEEAWWVVGGPVLGAFPRLLMPPGTVGYEGQDDGGLRDIGAFSSFDACSTANRALPPLEFDFDGGPLGFRLVDPLPVGNVGGENGDNPSWSLAKVSQACP